MLRWPEVVRDVSVCLVGVVPVHVVTELHELILGDFDGLFEDGPYDALGARGRRQTTVIAIINLYITRKQSRQRKSC